MMEHLWRWSFIYVLLTLSINDVFVSSQGFPNQGCPGQNLNCNCKNQFENTNLNMLQKNKINGFSILEPCLQPDIQNPLTSFKGTLNNCPADKPCLKPSRCTQFLTPIRKNNIPCLEIQPSSCLPKPQQILPPDGEIMKLPPSTCNSIPLNILQTSYLSPVQPNNANLNQKPFPDLIKLQEKPFTNRPNAECSPCNSPGFSMNIPLMSETSLTGKPFISQITSNSQFNSPCSCQSCTNSNNPGLLQPLSSFSNMPSLPQSKILPISIPSIPILNDLGPQIPFIQSPCNTPNLKPDFSSTLIRIPQSMFSRGELQEINNPQRQSNNLFRSFVPIDSNSCQNPNGFCKLDHENETPFNNLNFPLLPLNPVSNCLSTLPKVNAPLIKPRSFQEISLNQCDRIEPLKMPSLLTCNDCNDDTPVVLQVNVPPLNIPPPTIALVSMSGESQCAYPPPLPPIIMKKGKSKLNDLLPILLMAMMTRNQGGCCNADSPIPVPFPIAYPITA